MSLFLLFLLVAPSGGVSENEKIPKTGTCRVIATLPHDPTAFTQGLVYRDGVFYEGTGINGRSGIRIVEPKSGHVMKEKRLEEKHFGEGVAVFGEKIFQLTWRTRVGFIYNRRDLSPLGRFAYEGEGWGLTHDGHHLILSDGTSFLRFIDPDTFQEAKKIEVRDGDRPVTRLNELEYIKGEIWANVWTTGRVVRIDPATGRVTGWIDCSGLLSPEERRRTDVLNGIAYDTATGRIFVTGKLWPKVFVIELVPLRQPHEKKD